jgi:hypothetical protein
MGTLVVSHAPVIFGAEALGLPGHSASAKWGFCPGGCGNPVNLAGLPQLGTVDKAGINATNG